jgi:hypothetical protein
VLTLRFNAVNRPPGVTALPRQTFTSVFPGAQVFVRERFKLSFEYGFHNRDRPSIGAVQAELAF